MIVSFFLVVSFLDGPKKSDKFLLKVKRGIYIKARKKLFILDKKKNKKTKQALKKFYPVLKIENQNYVVYGANKFIRIEDIIPLDVSIKLPR